MGGVGQLMSRDAIDSLKAHRGGPNLTLADMFDTLDHRTFLQDEAAEFLQRVFYAVLSNMPRLECLIVPLARFRTRGPGTTTVPWDFPGGGLYTLPSLLHSGLRNLEADSDIAHDSGLFPTNQAPTCVPEHLLYSYAGFGRTCY